MSRISGILLEVLLQQPVVAGQYFRYLQYKTLARYNVPIVHLISCSLPVPCSFVFLMIIVSSTPGFVIFFLLLVSLFSTRSWSFGSPRAPISSPHVLGPFAFFSCSRSLCSPCDHHGLLFLLCSWFRHLPCAPSLFVLHGIMVSSFTSCSWSLWSSHAPGPFVFLVLVVYLRSLWLWFLLPFSALVFVIFLLFLASLFSLYSWSLSFWNHGFPWSSRIEVSHSRGVTD